MTTDLALETLLLPIFDGHLPWPKEGGALFLGARDGWPLHRQRLSGLICESQFKPEVDVLHRSGLTVLQSVDVDARYPLVLLLPPRQRDCARTLYARALQHLLPGGVLLVCQSNAEGAKSGEIDLSRVAGALTVLCKNKCRVFWTRPHELRDEALLASWRELDAPRRILEGRFVSRPGVFAWDRIDLASQLLAEHLPADLAGDAADLGAGFGFLGTELLSRCPGIRSLQCYEADARALDLARHNLQPFAGNVALDHHWHDVTQGITEKFDVIVSNPPFHAQQAVERPDIGRRFISAAAAALRPGGRLWLVANRHLPYESELANGFSRVQVVTQQNGFKVVEAIKAATSPFAAKAR
ncbi:MAG: class I SAM-dependent methyltransferase [Pseudomarimonas sp.]